MAHARCAEDERSESEGRFGEAEPVGCASIRERVDRVDGGGGDFSRKERKECVEWKIKVVNPQIGTDLHKSICGDKCGFFVWGKMTCIDFLRFIFLFLPFSP